MKLRALCFASLFAVLSLPCFAADQLPTVAPIANPLILSSMGHATPATNDCQALVQRMQDFLNQTAKLQVVVLESTYDIGSVIRSWYTHLSPKEGQTLTLSPGTFSPMKTSAQTVAENAKFFEDSFRLLDAEYTDQMHAVENCIKTNEQKSVSANSAAE